MASAEIAGGASPESSRIPGRDGEPSSTASERSPAAISIGEIVFPNGPVRIIGSADMSSRNPLSGWPSAASTSARVTAVVQRPSSRGVSAPAASSAVRFDIQPPRSRTR